MEYCGREDGWGGMPRGLAPKEFCKILSPYDFLVENTKITFREHYNRAAIFRGNDPIADDTWQARNATGRQAIGAIRNVITIFNLYETSQSFIELGHRRPTASVRS